MNKATADFNPHIQHYLSTFYYHWYFYLKASYFFYHLSRVLTTYLKYCFRIVHGSVSSYFSQVTLLGLKPFTQRKIGFIRGSWIKISATESQYFSENIEATQIFCPNAKFKKKKKLIMQIQEQKKSQRSQDISNYHFHYKAFLFSSSALISFHFLKLPFNSMIYNNVLTFSNVLTEKFVEIFMFFRRKKF